MAVSERKKREVVGSAGTRKAGLRRKGSGCVRGIRTLHVAAGKAVGQNSEKLTQMLVRGALDGDLRCAKLLLSLAEQEPEHEETGKSRGLWSAAMALAAEPEWREQGTEASGETAGGSKEAEG